MGLDRHAHWVRHPRIWWLMGAIGFLIAVWGFLAQDRSVPTYIGAQYVVPDVSSGDWMRMVMPAKRDISRRCSVEYTRTFINAEHSRLSPPARGFVSAEGVEARERETPGQLVLDVMVPRMPPGSSGIETENRYRCPWSTSWFWPIEDRWIFRFNVARVAQ